MSGDGDGGIAVSLQIDKETCEPLFFVGRLTFRIVGQKLHKEQLQRKEGVRVQRRELDGLGKCGGDATGLKREWISSC